MVLDMSLMITHLYLFGLVTWLLVTKKYLCPIWMGN